MSFVLRIVGFLILAMPLAVLRRCQNCSTSRIMVGPACYFHMAFLINSYSELSIAPEQNARLVPPHARKELLSRGIDLDNFTPLSQEDMKAQLE